MDRIEKWIDWHHQLIEKWIVLWIALICFGLGTLYSVIGTIIFKGVECVP